MPLEIIDYQPEYQADFYRLNAAWIEPNFGLEAEDVNFLQNPQQEILDKGGAIFFALFNGVVVGTCGLVRMDNTTCELVRLAVDSNYRNLKIGVALIDHSIRFATENHYQQLILESSTHEVNAKAVRLYEQLGFQHYIPRPEHRSALERANVWMKMDLAPVNSGK